jgi:SAM-dependent methyltransferase
MASEVVWVQDCPPDGNLEAFRNASGEMFKMVMDPDRVRDSPMFVAPEAMLYGIRVESTGFTFRFEHWSRKYEYPWFVLRGNFQPDLQVLDVGGGDSILQYRMAQLSKSVTNLDITNYHWNRIKERALHKQFGDNISFVQGDARDMPFRDALFSRVVCASVIEHIEDPEKVVKEMWRVLAPGGRLLVSMDIADHARWNHTIDMEGARKILSLLDLEMPPLNDRVFRMRFDEDTPGKNEPDHVDLRVICFYKDKE